MPNCFENTAQHVCWRVQDQRNGSYIRQGQSGNFIILSSSNMGSNVSCLNHDMSEKTGRPKPRPTHPRDLIKQHDWAVEQGKLIDEYIDSLSAKMASQASSGHISHGLLLIQRKCTAESVRQAYMRYAFNKYLQIVRCYRRAGVQVQRMTSEDYLTNEFQATDIAMGMCREYNLFNRGN